MPPSSPESPFQIQPRPAHLVAALALSVVILAIYGTISWGMFVGSLDFKAHIAMAESLYATGRPSAPHFLFHALVVLLFAAHIAPSFVAAGRLVMLACYFSVAFIMYALLFLLFQNARMGTPRVLFLASLATLAAEPITLAHAYKLGFLWPEPYQIPTSTLMKPFALVSFACTAWCFGRNRPADFRLILIFALATMAGCFSKPSFIICLLPASLVLLAYQVTRNAPVSLSTLLAGLYLPAMAVLAWQFYETYSGRGIGTDYHDSIIWGPLRFMSFWSSSLLLKFLLSILFPLLVTCCYWRDATRSPFLRIGWLCFCFGAFYSYMLVEKANWSSGNMVWSGYITLFTLFVAAMIFWLRQIDGAEQTWQQPRTLVCAAAIFLHALSGLRLDWSYLTHYGCLLDFRTAEFVCSQ